MATVALTGEAFAERRRPGAALRPESFDVRLTEILRRPVCFAFQVCREEPVVIALGERLIGKEREWPACGCPVEARLPVLQARHRAGLRIKRDHEMLGFDRRAHGMRPEPRS